MLRSQPCITKWITRRGERGILFSLYRWGSRGSRKWSGLEKVTGCTRSRWDLNSRWSNSWTWVLHPCTVSQLKRWTESCVITQDKEEVMHSSIQLVFAEHPFPSDTGHAKMNTVTRKAISTQRICCCPSLDSRGVNKPGISLQPKREANAQSLDQEQMDEDPSSLTGHMLTWMIRSYLDD